MEKIIAISEEEIENKIIDLIVSGSGNRLIVFKPENDPRGADLVAKKRGGYEKNFVFFKIYSFIGPVSSGSFTEDILQQDFNPEKDFYLIFAGFNEVKQEISDYIWVIPSLEFRDVVDKALVNGKKTLRFVAPVNIKEKNKYLRYLINKKELGKLLVDLFKSGYFNLKDVGVEEKLINIDELLEFIIEARKDALMGGSAPVDYPRLIGSVEINFKKGDFFYQHIFFKRQKHIIGLEVVYQNSRPIWAMNYFGSFIEKEPSEFLEACLLLLVKNCRLGKICELERKELKYKDDGRGDLRELLGKEQVFLKGKPVYELNYKGGLI